MTPDNYRPPYDSARGHRTQSACIATFLLVELLRKGSVEHVLARLGRFKEVLLFKFQLPEVSEALKKNRAALGLFWDLIGQGVVFHVVEAKPFESLQLHNEWQIVQFEAGFATDRWPFAVRMRELELGARLLLAKIRTRGPHVLLTDDRLERETAAQVGILCA